MAKCQHISFFYLSCCFFIILFSLLQTCHAKSSKEAARPVVFDYKKPLVDQILDRMDAEDAEDTKRVRLEQALQRTMAIIGERFGFDTKMCSQESLLGHEPQTLNDADVRNWLFDADKDDQCKSLRQKLSFNEVPLSEEEASFPLAYGVIVFKNAAQVTTMLSAFYQPQNVYVLGVDGRSTPQFKDDMELLGLCFPNVHVIHVGDVQWCKSSVLNALFKIFRYLTEMRHQWRYFQYLAGVDLPLKTNLEMVRILKQLNDTVNADVIKYTPTETELQTIEAPFTLWKSSMSALIPRRAADAMIATPKTRDLVRFLQFAPGSAPIPATCPDESLWTAVIGNPDLHIPGGFDAQTVYDRIVAERSELKRMSSEQKISERKLFPSNRSLAEPFELFSYYISRFQVWDVDRLPCHGKMVKESCVFGLADLPELLRRPEMVAHKIYWDFDSTIYFCLYKAIRERALDSASQAAFRGENYRHLSHVRLAAGEPIENISFHINAFPDFHFSLRRRLIFGD